MIIDRITFTGADDSVNPAEVLSRVITLATNTAVPIELGILLSRSNYGSVRFPSKQWIGKFIEAIEDFESDNGPLVDSLVTIAGHLCGSYVQDFLLGRPNIEAEMLELWEYLDRVQLNTHGIPHNFNKEAMLGNLSQDTINCVEFIFQIEDVNDHIFQEVLTTTELMAYPLFDGSHGTGVLPRRWPFPFYRTGLHGYAGGISPDNIEQVLVDINKVTNNSTEIWIDMETKVRSNNGNQFDLGLVTAVIEQIPKFGVQAGEIDEIDEEVESTD